MDTPRVDLSTPILVAGFWRNLFIEEWRARGTVAELDLVYRLQRDYVQRDAGQLATLTVIQDAALGPIDGAMRKALERYAHDIHPHKQAGTIVILGGGFGGAIVRSVLTGINFVRRIGFPNKIADSVDAGCEFIADFVAGGPGPRAVETAYRSLAAAPRG